MWQCVSRVGPLRSCSFNTGWLDGWCSNKNTWSLPTLSSPHSLSPLSFPSTASWSGFPYSNSPWSSLNQLISPKWSLQITIMDKWTHLTSQVDIPPFSPRDFEDLSHPHHGSPSNHPCFTSGHRVRLLRRSARHRTGAMAWRQSKPFPDVIPPNMVIIWW